MCCILSGEPIEDSTGRTKTHKVGEDGRVLFQTGMMDAPCIDCPNSGFWFCGQFLPPCMGCTQYNLRHKILEGDMKKYTCFQGYMTICCCIKAGSCQEESCPDFCAFMEGCFCNSCAVSASRMYTMEKYNLASDACDYRLIRISNCLQLLACVCNILAIIDGSFREIARIIDCIADCFYHTVSGCMSAQVAHEINYQHANPSPKVVNDFGGPAAEATPYAPQDKQNMDRM